MILMLAFLVVLGIEDICWQAVHDIILYGFLICGIAIWFIYGEVSFYEFAGGIICGGVLWICSRMDPGRLGCADGIVFAATGAFLGLMQNLLLMTISMFLAGVGSLFAVAVLKKKKDDTMPLIPYIAVGAVIICVMKKR